MKSINFVAALLSGNMICASVGAVMPAIDSEGTRKLLSEDDQISMSNPYTYGDFAPKLSGKQGRINLKFEDQAVSWTGIISDRGTIQAWGTPFLSFQSDDPIADIDAALRKLVQQNYNIFEVSPMELKLSANRTKISGPFLYVSYDRFYRGEESAYPIEGAFMTFRFKYGRLIEISNHTFGKVQVDEHPAISREDAIATVIQDSGFIESQDLFSRQVVEQLQPFYTENGQVKFRFVYQVSLRKLYPGGLWLYSVNSADGRIVRIMDRLETSGHVSAQVYSRLPSDQMIQVSLPETNVRNNGQTGRTDNDGNYSFEPEGTTAELSGIRAIVRESSSRLPSQSANGDGEILFSANQNLSENMAYFYVNKINAFVRNFISTAPRMTARGRSDFLNSPFTINTRVKDQRIKACNAWFDPDEKTLNFLEAGTVCKPGGECITCEASSHFADVIMHEWGHGLDDALGDGIQDGAFSEGIGDFTAILMTGDPKMAPGFFRGTDRPIRDVAAAVKIYPRDRSRDPHLESLIISGAWYETLVTMKKVYGDEEGRMKTANLFFKHLVSTHHYLDSYRGALVVDDDDGNLDNCTPNMCVLNIAFARRGIAEADPRCLTDEVQRDLPACAPSTVKPPRDE